MKKFMYFAAALLVLVGCNKNSQENKENAPQNLVTITGGIDFSPQAGARKVVAHGGWQGIESATDAIDFVWELGDEIAVFSAKQESTTEGTPVTTIAEIKKFTVSKILEDGKAEFIGEPLEGGMDTYTVAYPFEYANNMYSTTGDWYFEQQYSKDFRPSGYGYGSKNDFMLYYYETTFDLSLKGDTKLGKIEYWTRYGLYSGEVIHQASISMGKGGLQLTSTPQHVALLIGCRFDGHGFVLKFYDINNQLIMEKGLDIDMRSEDLESYPPYYMKFVSFPTLEVKAAPMHNGHEYVDLGLPSGLKWATCNVGATKEEEYGDYFAWGETEPYYSSLNPLAWKDGKETGYARSSHKYSYEGTQTASKYNSTDGKTTLDLDDDAANANWEGSWRMPTKDEFQELFDNCTWTWTENYNSKNVSGFIVKSKTQGNSNSIFLPASSYFNGKSIMDVGYYSFYWSASRSTEQSFYAYYSNCDYENTVELGFTFERSYGLPVRPVFSAN